MSSNPEFTLQFSEISREDVREIGLWYRSQVSGLDERFVANLGRSALKIQKNPYSYPICFGVIRVALLNRFPYRIYYFIEDRLITVIGVIHTKRTPKLIRKRYRNS